MAEHHLGATVRLLTTFTVGGVPTDPTTAELAVTKPDGIAVTPAPPVQSGGTGIRYADVLMDQAGAWPWEWTGTGAAAGVDYGVELVVAGLTDQAQAALLARERLRIMLAAEEEPVISDYELELLVAIARRPDIDGRGFDEDAWEPTYAYGSAAAEGWTWKAGRVANRVDIADEAAKLSRSQQVAQFLRMAAEHRRRPMAAVRLYRPDLLRASAVLEGWEALLPGAQGPLHLGPPYESPLALPGAWERGDNTFG